MSIKSQLVRGAPIIVIGAVAALDFYLNTDHLRSRAIRTQSTFTVGLIMIVVFMLLPIALGWGIKELGDHPSRTSLRIYALVLVVLFTVGEMLSHPNSLEGGIWMPSLGFAVILVEIWARRAFPESRGLFSTNHTRRSSNG